MKSKMCKFVVKDLGLGDDPYNQNIPESVNGLLKDWNNFKPQEMDKLIFALYDLVQSFNGEEELAWFGLSEKWDVRKEFQHLRPKPFSSLLPEERQTEMSMVRRIRPDAVACKKCRLFKFESKLLAAQSGATNVKVRVTGLTVKADALIANRRFREGFQDGSFFVDSGVAVPHKVDPTKIIIRKKDRPEDPPITSTLVVKRIAGGIRKCAGCSKEINSIVIGFNQDEDSQ
ncbi:unnamed protein product, partial [Porites lobata]